MAVTLPSLALLALLALPPLSAAFAPAPPGATSVILVLTDDEDTELGGASSGPLPQASRLFGAQGRSFTNYWVAAPMCVPSRVSMLSGMFPYPSKGNRGWQAGVSGNETVGSYAAQAGIKTGYFGKYSKDLDTYPGRSNPTLAEPSLSAQRAVALSLSLSHAVALSLSHAVALSLSLTQ